MTGEHVATAPHEMKATLWYPGTLAPYWALSGAMLGPPFEGSDAFEFTLPTADGGRPETWEFDVYYQQGKIKPADRFDLDASAGMYEWRLVGRGDGHRKATFHVRPRFAGMKHVDTGDPIKTPWVQLWPSLDDDPDADVEGVDVVADGSNVEPDLSPRILVDVVDGIVAEAGRRWQKRHLDPTRIDGDHSNISVFERYVRLNRDMAKKLTHKGGYFWRLMYHLAGEAGTKMEYRVDNTKIVGYNHRVLLPREAIKRLPGQKYGKQLKVYQPEHVRKKDPDDPLFSPKFGALFKKGRNDENSIRLNRSSVAWNHRDTLTDELEATIINTLEHAGVPTDSRVAFVADDHFQAVTTDRPVEIHRDVTPELEAEQEAVLVRTFRDLTDADLDVLEQIVADGGRAHYTDVAEDTGRGVSTIYRALDRMDGLLESDNGFVRARSQKVVDELRELLAVTDDQVMAAAKAAGRMLEIDDRHLERTGAAFQKWLARYAGELIEDDTGKVRLKVDSILSRIRSGSAPYLGDVLAEGREAWARLGRDPVEYRQAVVEYTSPQGERRREYIGAALDDADRRPVGGLHPG